MKRKLLHCLILMPFLCLVFAGCNEKEGCTDPISINYDPDAEKNDGSCQYAGTGGSTTLKLYPEHHGAPIFSTVDYLDSVFIEFNAINLPNQERSAYDIVKAGVAGEDHIHVEGLTPGKYFIFMTGWDTSINEKVEGGIPYTLTVPNGEVDLVIPVTED